MPKKKTNKWNLKKVIYVLLAVVLGKLLGFIAFGLLSIEFIKMLTRRGLPVEYDQIFWFVYSPLPAYLYWTLIYAGVIGGFFLGMRWWQMVYVEHRHWKKWGK
ncbi:MAG TPA: hypothetical protein VMQ48_01130 [Candidatus Saccharimonadales bacterium]|nr:hypothetical protein [Candidatus Saccharimonadales bacterium]